MNDDKKSLQGSKYRDIFKRCHKEKTHYLNYGCDLDFVLVEKREFGRKAKAIIVAFLDYKRLDDIVTFAEGVVYTRLMEIAPIYEVKGNDPENGPFTIKQILSVDWIPEPPIVTYGEKEVTVKNWTEFHAWESELRNNAWLSFVEKEKGEIPCVPQNNILLSIKIGLSPFTTKKR